MGSFNSSHTLHVSVILSHFLPIPPMCLHRIQCLPEHPDLSAALLCTLVCPDILCLRLLSRGFFAILQTHHDASSQSSNLLTSAKNRMSIAPEQLLAGCTKVVDPSAHKVSFAGSVGSGAGISFVTTTQLILILRVRLGVALAPKVFPVVVGSNHVFVFRGPIAGGCGSSSGGSHSGRGGVILEQLSSR